MTFEMSNYYYIINVGKKKGRKEKRTVGIRYRGREGRGHRNRKEEHGVFIKQFSSVSFPSTTESALLEPLAE